MTGGGPDDPAADARPAGGERAQLRRLEAVALLEATTLVLLVAVAMPLKHLAGWSAGVRVMGPVHGFAFLAFMWTAVQTVSGGGWTRGEAARLLLLALVPFGGYLNAPLVAGKLRALGPGR